MWCVPFCAEASSRVDDINQLKPYLELLMNQGNRGNIMCKDPNIPQQQLSLPTFSCAQ